jgi:hypothetical protein
MLLVRLSSYHLRFLCSCLLLLSSFCDMFVRVRVRVRARLCVWLFVVVMCCVRCVSVYPGPWPVH